MESHLPHDAYRSEDAILLAGMCYQTYPFFEKDALSLPKGYELRYTMRAIAGVSEPEEGVFGFIAESGNQIVLALRGTVNLADSDSDLDMFQTPYPYREGAGRTHRGITCIYQSMRDGLIRELTALPSTKRLLVTGHSLGGDLAILASLDIATNTRFEDPIVYTLAAGRIGDPAFAACFDDVVKGCHRIHNVHDFIPTLPAEEYPSSFVEGGLAYRHVGTEHPLSFQTNSIPLNHRINRYLEALGEEDLALTAALRADSPGFWPDGTPS